jgi:hypothetical protein
METFSRTLATRHATVPDEQTRRGVSSWRILCNDLQVWMVRVVVENGSSLSGVQLIPI